MVFMPGYLVCVLLSGKDQRGHYHSEIIPYNSSSVSQVFASSYRYLLEYFWISDEMTDISCNYHQMNAFENAILLVRLSDFSDGCLTILNALLVFKKSDGFLTILNSLLVF